MLFEVNSIENHNNTTYFVINVETDTEKTELLGITPHKSLISFDFNNFVSTILLHDFPISRLNSDAPHFLVPIDSETLMYFLCEMSSRISELEDSIEELEISNE